MSAHDTITLAVSSMSDDRIFKARDRGCRLFDFVFDVGTK